MLRFTMATAVAVWGAVVGVDLAKPPKVKFPRLAVVAAGDSVCARFWYTPVNKPDSVVTTFSIPNATPIRVPQPGTANNTGRVCMVPTPVLAEGDSALVIAAWSVYKKQLAPVQGATTKWFKRPVTPANIIPDSLNVSSLFIMGDPLARVKDTATGLWHEAHWVDSVTGTGPARPHCLAFTFKDNGKIALRTSERADTFCTRLYATTVGQLQRYQSVTYANGVWTVGPVSPARQAAIDRICVSWTFVPMTPTVTGIVSQEQCNGGTGRGGTVVASTQ